MGRYFDQEKANKLFNRIHSNDIEPSNSLKDIASAFHTNMMPKRNKNDKQFIHHDSMLFNDHNNNGDKYRNGYNENNNGYHSNHGHNHHYLHNGNIDKNVSIEFEYKQNENEHDRLEENESAQSCPCCDSTHNIDDNINTHLTEISKLYNLNHSKEWKKFLLLPLHRKKTKTTKKEKEFDDDDNDDEKRENAESALFD